MMRAVLCALLAVPLAAQTVIKSSGATGGGGGAPTNAQYWLGAANGELSAEIVVNDIASLESAIAAYDFNDASNLTTGTIPEARIGAFSSLVNINGGFEIADMRCTASAGVMTCQDPTATTGITSVIVKGGAGQSANSIWKVDNSAGTETYLNILADDNIRIGINAGDAITTGTDNVALGDNALGGATAGSYNVAIGSSAMPAATTTSGTRYNVGIGRGALGGCNGCELNVVIGDSAGNDIVAGDRNTIIGASAHNSTSNTSDNVIIGYGAGSTETGSSTLIIDNQSRGAEAAGRTNSLIYGTFNATPASQTLHLNAAVRATYGLEVGNVGAIIYAPSATEPVDCTTSNDGAMYFDTDDQKLCICANDGTDDEWLHSDNYGHVIGHCSI